MGIDFHRGIVYMTVPLNSFFTSSLPLSPYKVPLLSLLPFDFNDPLKFCLFSFYGEI